MTSEAKSVGPLTRRSLIQGVGALAGGSLLLASAGCESGKESEQYAVDTLTDLGPNLAKDAANVREGLPSTAEKIVSLLPADPVGDPEGTRTAILGAKERDEKLRVAPISYLAFVDMSGVVVRNFSQKDGLAQQQLFTAFPALKDIATADKPLEAFGELQAMRAVVKGDDLAWVIAAKVNGANKTPKGFLVSGWALRGYGTFLQGQATRYVTERGKKGDNKVPVMYAYLVKGAKAYGAIETPDANAEAVAKLDLPSKVKSGNYRSKLDITGRTFGVAAMAAPEMGDDAAIAVVVSML